MTNRFINPRPQFLDASGRPLLKAEMDFFENGTLIRKDTFTDVNEENKNPNPVPLNADGSMPNVFYAGTARVRLRFDVIGDEQQRFDVDGVGLFGDGAAFDVFNTLTEYEDGALVEASDGEYYRSLQNNNTGNDPLISPTFWERLEFIRVFNANVTYGTDDIAKASNGLIFRSLQANNIGNDPLTSPTFWGTPVAFVDLNILGDLSFAATELTIAGGGVTAETSHHTIDTEADAPADDLLNITVASVADGTMLILRLADAARVVTIKDGLGNIQTKNNEDIILDANIPTILLLVGTDWFEVQRPVADNPFDQNLNTTDDVVFDKMTTGDADINGGAIDGTIIGGSVLSTGSFTTLSLKNVNTQLRIFDTDGADPLDEARFEKNFDITRLAHFDNSATTIIPYLEATMFTTTVLFAGDGTQGLLIAPSTGRVTFSNTIRVNNTVASVNSGTGSPEGVLTAAVGSIFMRTDGGASTTLFVKESGAGNTGWVGK